jgi:hypothetical protein
LTNAKYAILKVTNSYIKSPFKIVICTSTDPCKFQAEF